MTTTFRYLFNRSTKAASVALVLAASAVFSSLTLAEPPNRVGRVSLVEGNVSFFMDRSEGWKPARINYPVTSENSVWTEGASRAEVRIGASALRLNDNSIVDFIRIDDDQTQAYLQRGTINIRTRNDNSDNRDRDRDRDLTALSIETNEGRFVIESNGRYAINASADGVESRISVYAGRARFEGSNGDNAVPVDRGRTLVVFGQKGATNFRFETAAESNFDRWADARDRSWDQAHTRYASTRIVSSYMTGYEDLDTYGDWVDNGEYGRIWAPRNVSSDWAPYRNGSWSYVNPWGWTWVDDAPWGFAPFHYGRWVTVGSRWCWWPGQYNRRPAYAPALVAWYGRPGLSVNVSVGSSVGWFPLAPHEYYAPRYTNNVTYIRNVNYVTNNVTIINNNPPQRYQNQVPGATFVNQNVFVQSKPIAMNAIRATPAMTANYVPQQVVDVPRPIMQGQPVIGGAPMQGGAQGTPNSAWARGRNNVAPVYAAQPALQGQPQNQIPGRAVAGAAVAGAAIGAVGAAAIINNNGAPQVRGNAVGNIGGAPQNAIPINGIPQNATPQPGQPAITPAPVMRGGGAVGNTVGNTVGNAPINNAKPMMQQPTAMPPPLPVSAAPNAPNVIPRPQTQTQPQNQGQTQQPQPAYLQGAKPNVTEPNAQARVRQNRVPESTEPNMNQRARPQRENVVPNVAPAPRQEQRQEQPQPQRQEQRQERQMQGAQRAQQQAQQPVQQQGPQPRAQPQQPQQQAHPQAQQQQHAEKPQHAEKQQNAPRVEGQGKPEQQQK